MARAAQAFGLEPLIANRPGGAPVAGRHDLHDLLPQVDVLSLHCPLTPATEGMIGAAQLARMKHDAVLINTARGALVDSAALADALRNGRLGGAAIDVLPQEPPVGGNPLLATDIPNLIVTPHIAWAAREARQRCIDEMAANVEDFRQGRTAGTRGVRGSGQRDSGRRKRGGLCKLRWRFSAFPPEVCQGLPSSIAIRYPLSPIP